MSKNLIPHHEDFNTSNNPSFNHILDARLSRRSVLLGSGKTAVAAAVSGFGLAACGGGNGIFGSGSSGSVAGAQPSLLGFSAVSKSLSDTVTVPVGYTVKPIYALGDPLNAVTPAYGNVGNDSNYQNRAGDHHDGMEWFGLSDTNRPSSTSNERGLLAINHEATTDETLSSFFLHATGGTATLPRPAAEVDKETAIHGVSIVEVKKTAGA